MKKIYCLMLSAIIFTTLFFSSCSMQDNANESSNLQNILDRFILAIKEQNKEQLIATFSVSTQHTADEFDLQIIRLLNFVQGDVILPETIMRRGENNFADSGKLRKEKEVLLQLDTTENTYFINILICTVDTFSSNNVGIKSMYIINAKDWHEDYMYGCNGQWTPGINIDTAIQKTVGTTEDGSSC